MGLKISAVLIFAIMMMGIGFKAYYDKTEAELESLALQLAIAATNEDILKTEIQGLNQSIKDQQESTDKMMRKVSELQQANQEAVTETTNLRTKFARHDMNMLSLRKPALIEKIINKGTKDVFNDLSVITTHD